MRLDFNNKNEKKNKQLKKESTNYKKKEKNEPLLFSYI